LIILKFPYKIIYFLVSIKILYLSGVFLIDS
jgi:hypothetical protein